MRLPPSADDDEDDFGPDKLEAAPVRSGIGPIKKLRVAILRRRLLSSLRAAERLRARGKISESDYALIALR
jgi:hypothetical protein